MGSPGNEAKNPVQLSELWQTHKATISPPTGYSCLFSAWLAIHAVNYVVKLFVSNENIINFIWPILVRRNELLPWEIQGGNAL